VTAPASMSTSSQCRPRASPRRIPVMASRRQRAKRKIDISKPVTVIPHAASCRSGAKLTLAFRIVDAKPSCGRARVTLHILNATGKVVRKIPLGIRPTNKAQSFRFRCTLPRGDYRLMLYAADLAGNRQSKVGSNRLTVR